MRGRALVRACSLVSMSEEGGWDATQTHASRNGDNERTLLRGFVASERCACGVGWCGMGLWVAWRAWRAWRGLLYLGRKRDDSKEKARPVSAASTASKRSNRGMAGEMVMRWQGCVSIISDHRM